MKDLFSIKNKAVCVIGGTGLIGSRIVSTFAEREAYVFVGTRFPKKHKSKRKRVRYVEIDIRSSKSIRDFIDKVTFKGKKIDVWINCALPRTNNSAGRIERVNSEIIAAETEAHLMGFYRCCKEILVHMKKFKSGVIINFGSVYGSLSPDFRIYENTEISKSAAYPLIKGGIHAFTKYLACYLAPYNIRVNAVCPGGVLDKHSKRFQRQYSNRVPLKRMAHPDEIAGPVLFLASDSSSYVTGQLLCVDGGLSAW